MTITPASELFSLSHQSFKEAVFRVGKMSLFYRLIEKTVCIQLASTFPIDLVTFALKHLQQEPCNAPDFTILVWDSATTGAPPVSFLEKEPVTAFRGEVLKYNTDQIYTVIDIHTKAFHAFDHEKNLGLYWIQDSAKLPWWVMGCPLQLIFHWWLRSQGRQLTHVAAVGYSEGGVLLAGKGGSGKSTTTLSCMKAGMRCVGEDYSILSDLPQIMAHSIYHFSKIEPSTLQRFPELEKQIINSARAKEDKALVMHSPDKILISCPIRALLVLKMGQVKNSRLESVNWEEALKALSISTLWQLTHTGPVVFKHLERIVKNLPCYTLYLGSDLAQIPQVIEEVL